MEQAILHIEHLVKRYGTTGVNAVDGIDFEVFPGELFCLLGVNGAGKSTTIRVLLGILRASGGKVSLFGMDSWNDSVDIHRRIAYVPGDVSLWPNLTGGEVIDFFGNLRGGINEEKRARLIKEFDLDTTKKCRTYSKGNRQKVALVAAFASDADLYILDEPTSGLDPLMEQIFIKYLEEAKAEGKTIFLSSHILVEVERVCDRVAIIRDGEIVEQGDLSVLKGLSNINMTVQTKKPLKGLEKIKGVSNIDVQGDVTTFQAEEASVGNVVSFIAPFDVIRFESNPPSLEELFMRHYGEGKRRGAN